MFNEQDHPRDEDGKFTFKNGGENSKSVSPVEILYGKKTREERFKKQRRNELLTELKDKLTPAQVLYSSNGDLEKMLHKKERVITDTTSYTTDAKLGINENIQSLKAGLGSTKIEKLQTDDEKFEKNVEDMEKKIEKTIRHPISGKAGTTIKGGPDAAGMLNLAEGKKLPIYTKDSTELININDDNLYLYNNGDIKKFKSHIEDKVLNQFKDFGYNLNSIEGRIFHSNSAPTKRIKESDDFKDALVKNKEQILKGKNFSKRFTNYGNNQKSNLHNAFGSVDFLNSGIDNNGNLHLYMFDTYDFNAGENPKVEAGRRQMLKGNLKGHFTLHDIIVTKQELDEIWNK